MIGQFVVDQLRESPDCEYFDDVNESKLDENNPKKMVCVYNQKMADLCNKNKISMLEQKI